MFEQRILELFVMRRFLRPLLEPGVVVPHVVKTWCFPWKEWHVQQSKRLPVVSDHDQCLTRIAWDHRVIGGIDDDRRHPWDPCGLVSEDKSVASHAVPESSRLWSSAPGFCSRE